MPAAMTAGTRPGLNALQLVGRLAPGVTHAEAEGEVRPILQQLLSARDTSLRADVIDADVQSFPAVQFGQERLLVFTVLNLLAALILLLAIVNVTNLLLARANERIRETAVRLALGASAGRLVVQGMWETVLLRVTGGIVGTAGASWGLDAITRWTQAHMEGNLAFWWVWQMNRVTLIGAGAFVTMAIAVLGAVVALRATRTNVREVLQDGSARSGSRREGRLSRILVTTQVATVTILMFVGALAAVVAGRVVNHDPGYDTTNLLQGGIEPPPGRYATPGARADAYRNVYARLSEHAALDRVLVRYAMAEKESGAGRFALRDTRTTGTAPSAHVQAMLGAGATIGMRIIEGRALTDSDDSTGAPVAVVSRAVAERYWRGRSPVGDQLRLAAVGDTTTWRTIVGVASDVVYGNPLSPERSAEAIYVPLLQVDAPWAVVLARHRASELAGRAALLQAFRAYDPLLPPTSVQPYTEVLQKMGLIATSVRTLFTWCFAFALLLAVVGTYGLMARSIGLRQREIGVRRALGATDAGVSRLLLEQGARQLGIGTLMAMPLLGLIAAIVRQFFPLGAWLAVGLALGVSVSIVAVVLGATWVPTRHVLKVSPRDALWSE
jgi:predicted permease